MESTAGKKGLWRRQLRAQRNALTPTERQRLGAEACQHLAHHPQVLEAHRLALYVPRTSELDCTQILDARWRQGRECLLPRVVGDRLEFSVCASLADLKPGLLGIPEPQGPAAAVHSIDIMVLPGLGFDRDGNRLGYGRGYYDRALYGYEGVSFGMTYACCVIDKLPVEPHDQPVQWLVTEKGCWRARS